MENILKRFPVSWIRKIQTVVDDEQEFTSNWQRVLVRTSVETVKELSVAVHQFYQLDESRYNEKWSPLHITVMQDDLSLSRHVMSKMDEMDPKNSDGITPLHFAASNGNFELFKLTFDRTTKKNPATLNGYTPMYVAAVRGFVDICKLIIDNVYDKNPAINNGSTPLFGSCPNRSLGCM